MPAETDQPPLDVPDVSASLAQLRWSLQSLATAGSEQPPLFAEHAASAEALVSAFDRCAALVQTEHGGMLSSGQTGALAALSRQLATISRDGAQLDADLWTDAAVRTSEHWAVVRQLASTALDAFDRR